MISYNQLETQRLKTANELKEKGINPYPHFIRKDMSIAKFKSKFNYITELDDKKEDSILVSLAGRIKLMRIAGKAVFANIEDESGSVQIYFNKNTLGEEWFNEVKNNIEVGDIIRVRGYAFVTQKGEFSLHVNELQLATKAISPLPEKYHGLVDIEIRYRQRYLDMIMNPEVKKDFKTRSIVISTIRKFIEEKGFLEVETPMMHPIAGGANARPFVTFHNTLGVDRFLRIAPELYLKRLVVGGFEAVYEMNRCFRNEGMDLTHNPEFTSIEFYWAYHTYRDLMNLTEELFSTLLDALDMDKIIEFDGMKLDFSKPFARINYKKAITEIGGIDPEIVEDREKILEKLNADGFLANDKLDLGHLQAELFDNYVEEKLINPTFIVDFPISISPLSRRSDDNPMVAERFELFIAGRELANGFNELNDPIDQYERFAAQIEGKKAGDDEAHEMDEDYVRALSHGMPPTAGEGLGIDRLVMLLTNKKSIRDVILFPAMRPLKSENKKGE
ncbi:lysine--tRNA ligase [Campylobacter pinnipediorum]|uniref:Lysine--tRNA ligase n=1 Tax=Campylobacter pinnipediorum subsp. pinnipediorum TaxID=1660067 RepID=A0AAX0L8L0_9BACT|nr:lysyl-tRNA synthetase [Campylobacter pinnipediorum subsp. pinnipediorum]AQW83643.1 lysyl-tRNA synthetase [Campylobacter pinnipediorum subsp. pinnipediorum]AQW85165.1 lysyl-tRNA synthetase [Campylobacter pinnipediorum subsp. pinnipediorum]OPA75868.1 lysine--tRNA ligase [Campylobacter pinnipediorum subsp. pinnipediorum]OPA76021.1 lysine--tRNA ligase [Campylobacter pinnipediorum subsp. pinnipediorum]